MLPPFCVQVDTGIPAERVPDRVQANSDSKRSTTRRRRRIASRRASMINPSKPVAPHPPPPPPPPFEPRPRPGEGGGGVGVPDEPPPFIPAFSAQPGFVPSPA